MLAKIISSGALTLLLTGSALAYQPYNPYAGHSNSAQPQMQTQQSNNCRQGGPSWRLEEAACPGLAKSTATANAAPYGYNDTQGSHALGGGPG
jgi:hypothetical protein